MTTTAPPPPELTIPEIIDMVSKTIIHSFKRIQCPRCGHEWNYKGKSNYRADCYNCHTSVIFNPKKKKKWKVKRYYSWKGK